MCEKYTTVKFFLGYPEGGKFAFQFMNLSHLYYISWLKCFKILSTFSGQPVFGR